MVKKNEIISIDELGKLYLLDNMAEGGMIDEQMLAEIGSICKSGFEIDVESIATWRKEVIEIRKLAKQEKADKTTPWPNASNVKFPLITVSAYQFNARSYASIINNNHVALARVVGKDEDGKKARRASRVSQHMSDQLTEQMDGWEADMDMLLLALPIDGVCFKKVYYDNISEKNMSEFVLATDLVVNDNTKNFATAARISMEFSLYPYEVKEYESAGLFIVHQKDEEKDEEKSNNQTPVDFVEQHCRWDIDGDGYAEPYVVTYEKDTGFVVRVQANFQEDDIISEGDKVLRITPTQYFIKYECFPDSEGGFYSRGFGALLKPISDSIDTILNQIIDAGTLANMQGGFLGNGFRVASGNLKFKLGEWKKVDVGAGTLRDNIMPMPINQPSAVLFSVLGTLIEAGKEISSIQDVMTGGGGANQPATTTLALIEQGMTVYTAIFKRIYRALKEELRLLYDLNTKYLTEDNYMNIADNPEASLADYESDRFDIAPAADPKMATDMQKNARAQIIAPYMDHPLFNGQKIALDVLTATGVDNPEEYMAPPKTEPTMEEAQEAAKVELEKTKVDNETRLVDIKAQEADSKSKETDSKVFVNLSNALKAAAETDELGGDNLLNAEELQVIQQLQEKLNERRTIPEVESGQPLAIPAPQQPQV